MSKKTPRLSFLYKILVVAIVIVLPFLYFLKKIIYGEIPFWYDSARDFIQASTNLHNPTLIGPPSGIPGVFYGPYWIWLISIGESFTKNPRFTAFLLGVIPYGIIFPFVLYKLSRKWGIVTGIIIWGLFVASYAEDYTITLWNPHIAPVFFLIYIYLVLKTDFLERSRRNSLQILIAGFVGGLIANFHISFGIGVLSCSYLWFILYYFLKPSKIHFKRRLLLVFTSLTIFSIGLIVAFAPFFLFELKNGFHQIKATIDTVTAPGAVVAQTGLNNQGILNQFVLIVQKLLHVSYSLALIVIMGSIVLSIVLFVKKLKLKKQIDYKATSFLLMLLICLGSIYLSSKNPVWEYHFIGVEVIILVLIGILISQLKILKTVMFCLLIFILLNFSFYAIKDLETNQLTIPTLSTKEYITELIYKDAGNKKFEIFVYSPSIYMFDYSYIFGYKGSKKYVPAHPEEVPQDSNLVYIILPPGEEGKRQDFIHYRTPIEKYKTTKRIDIPDGTQIVKRERIKEEK